MENCTVCNLCNGISKPYSAMSVAEMQAERRNAIHMIKCISAKEITLFFASPIAWLFLTSFVVVSLFVFFWAEAFFSRNIADVRPLFEWMPILLIFLSSALTMRLWSEERRTGTLEHVLTQAVPLWHFVVGKFIACLILLAIALLMTVPLPITVSFMGDLDWGPVFAAYLATFLLGSAYLGIGLLVSARSDNQIVSLILATIICSLFYLLGSPTLTTFFGNEAGEWLRLFGSGSRFESITRGVLDLRDLYYYLSIVAVALALNAWMLERERWTKRGNRLRHRQWRALSLLLAGNFLVGNFWLGQMHSLRVDVTEGQQFSISEATLAQLRQLEQPLLMRAYFSEKTHPLLAPLIPQLRDLMREYEIAGLGRVKVEVVDPAGNPDIEKEASQKYDIKPIPFQVEDRYQSTIVSSYFDILLQYGDEFETLSFSDLIEVRSGNNAIDVRLLNPEYVLTRAIKKILNKYRSGGKLFDAVLTDLRFHAYVSSKDRLPEVLQDSRSWMTSALEKMRDQSGGKFKFDLIDPDADGGKVARRIQDAYGFRPMARDLLGQQTYYFYLIISQGQKAIQLQLDKASKEGFQRALEIGVRRFAKGYTQKVGLIAPGNDEHAQQMGATSDHVAIQNFLANELEVEQLKLSESGTVPSDIDVLVVTGSKNIDDRELFAIDQFLMRGGTVIAATSPLSVQLSAQSLQVLPQRSGLGKWLGYNGLKMEEKLVMDVNSGSFPMPIERKIGNISIQEVRLLNYPYFLDIRSDGMADGHIITGDLPRLLIPWAAPIQVEENTGRDITVLLQSSENSWLGESGNVTPRIKSDGSSGFTPAAERSRHVIGVISSGRFDSWFVDKPNPLLENNEPEQEASADGQSDGDGDKMTQEQEQKPNIDISGVIEHSADSARIILVSSSDMLRDQIMQLSGTANRSNYQGNMQFIANAVDWSLEDSGLLGIRSRSNFNRALLPMTEEKKRNYEFLNYALVVALLGIAMFLRFLLVQLKPRRYARIFAASKKESAR
ncbi:MAG: Gldg family protein [Candidatus Eutrophobiaceae bacterium]